VESQREALLPAPNVEPVNFRQQLLSGPKSFFSGTQRSAPPSETLDLVRPYLRRAGVTRIADVTGLDKVGIPTTLAIRPNAPTMACSSGKGLSLDAAIVSGAMEAIELYAAENIQLHSLRRSYRELVGEFPAAPLDRLPLSKRSLFSKDWPFKWVLGWDVSQQRETAVPRASVVMSKGRADLSDLGAFVMSSNGLASGNSLIEAMAAALYEVVERDAVACTTAAWRAGVPPVQLTTRASVYPDVVREVLDQCRSAGVRVAIFDTTVDTQIPTFVAYAYDSVDEGIGIYRGYGAHLDSTIALLRAITEALQGRLNFIAGSRDDIFRSAFWRTTRARSRSFAAGVAAAESEGTTVAPSPSFANQSFEEDINTMLVRLARAGLTQVVVLDLTPPDCPVSVVRVVVPGAEGYMHFGYTPGLRASRYEECPQSGHEPSDQR